ncbi:MAG: Unknown protein [uncultured Sulfurovum sp.]|uniref:Uncharacterized protein n=1 Tax=uncultured Sulfurovum sp. TaxID=269237 RepID=A0A6S6SV24_9BACT|nr:MAG: Unknown protein [uncultured Sulfurovum sp.]
MVKKPNYLTLLGGVFGNEIEWIISAIERAVSLYRDFELDVVVVNYGSISDEVLALVESSV